MYSDWKLSESGEKEKNISEAKERKEQGAGIIMGGEGTYREAYYMQNSNHKK